MKIIATLAALAFAAPALAQGTSDLCQRTPRYFGCLPPVYAPTLDMVLPLSAAGVDRSISLRQLFAVMPPGNGGAVSAASPAFTGTMALTTALAGAARASAQTITTTAVGSGTNGPTTAQAGLTVNLSKNNWFTGGATVGEIDGAYITVRQGGAGSDAAGMLLDVQNTGTGFLAGIEMQVTAVNTATNTLTRDIDIQTGVLDGINAGYYGQVLTAATGSMTTAIRVQSAAGASWNHALEVQKTGVLTTILDDVGNLDLNGTVRAGRGLANALRLQGSVSGSGPAVTVEGTDANIALVLQPKGVGQVFIGSGMQVLGSAALGADKANFINIIGALSGTGPVINAAGSDANVTLVLSAKGTGQVYVSNPLAALLAGTVKTLDVGAADSAGTGFRTVRVVN